MDQPRPTVERVPARRSLPIAVGVVGIVVTATLAWQPWADRPLAPTPPGAEAVSSPSSRSSVPLPTGSPEAAPSATRRPLPSPDLGPLDPAGDFVLMPPPGSALVECRYSRLRDGRRYFRALQVRPPTVTAFNDEEGVLDVRRVSWRVEIQANQLDSVFDREWETVARSRVQVARATQGAAAQLFPLSVEHRVHRDGTTTVLRALVIVEWHTRNLELAGRVEAVANSYLEADASTSQVQAEGCRGVLEPLDAQMRPSIITA